MKKPRANTQCQVCRHEHRWRIELLRAGGAGLDALAQKFNVSRDSIWRHWKDHVSDEAKATYLVGPASMEKLIERAAEEGDSILDYLKIARGTLLAQLSAMNIAGDAKNVGYVVGQLVRVLETIARITGELGDMARTVNIQNNLTVLQENPAFAKVQASLLRALAPFPAARAAVVAALRDLDAETAPVRPAAPAIGKVIDHVPA